MNNPAYVGNNSPHCRKGGGSKALDGFHGSENGGGGGAGGAEGGGRSGTSTPSTSAVDSRSSGDDQPGDALERNLSTQNDTLHLERRVTYQLLPICINSVIISNFFRLKNELLPFNNRIKIKF